MEESIASTSNRAYDVFINHRGPDVKRILASTIYYWLRDKGLRVFFDAQEFQPGEELNPTLADAIATASAHIAIFSSKYAESSWCLEELCLMLRTGAPIIPVYYVDVQPSDLRWIENGAYAYAFAEHEKKGRFDSQKLDEWKTALRLISNRHGLRFEGAEFNSDHGKLLNSIVENVLKYVKKAPLNVVKHPVGLDEAVRDFDNFLSECGQNEKVRTVGIVGLGGSGKSTLAKELYDRKRSSFNRSSFLSDVASAKNSLENLQSQLLAEVAGIKMKFNNTSEGKGILRENLRSLSVLIVLDGIDNEDQLDAVLMKDVVGSGSLIILTSRDKSVLKLSKISLYYKMKGLNPTHSQELFCWHAFGQPHPTNGFEDLVEESLRKCGGLPLFLKVIGAHLHLYGNDNQQDWSAELEKMFEKSDILKVTYDALWEEEKQIFLDIACFFVGEDKSLVTRIWDVSGRRGSRGLLNLEYKCLVEIDEEYRIKMHDHLRDLGREIANQHPPYRLWHPEQAYEILNQESLYRFGHPDRHDNEELRKETLEVRGIMAATNSRCPWESYKPPFDDLFGQRGHFRGGNSSGLKLLAIKGNCFESEFSYLSTDLLWLRWHDCPHRSIPSWLSMEKLRVLELVDGGFETLWQDDCQGPLQLRELNVSWSSLGELPRSIKSLIYLEKMVLSGQSSVESLPEEFCYLKSLKHLDLSYCKSLISLPDNLGDLANLQHLDCSHCVKLQMLPMSFGHLTLLQYLNLYHCNMLMIQPQIFRNISTLKELNFEECWELEELPIQIVCQGSLKKLNLLQNKKLQRLPDDLGNLSNLEILRIGSPLLTCLPDSLGSLSRLTHLELDGCTELICLPESLGQLNRLAVLNLSDLPLQDLPGGLSQLSNRQTLTVSKCPISDLALTNGSMSRLKMVEVVGTNVSKISILTEVAPNLKILKLFDNEFLTEVETLPVTLVKLRLKGCAKMKTISVISDLAELQELDITECSELQELPSLSHLSSLIAFEAGRCFKLQSIRGLEHLSKLQHLDITECYRLQELPDLRHLDSLERFKGSVCWKLRRIQGLEHLTKLQELNISVCEELDELPDLADLGSLKNLIINKCIKLQSIRGLPHLISLEELRAAGCVNLQSIHGLECLANLQHLDISDCSKLDVLPSLASLSSLKNLTINGCRKLVSIDGVECLTSLETIEAGGCWRLERIGGLDRLRRRLTFFKLSADNGGIWNSIQRLQRLPCKMILSGRAVPEVEFILNSLSYPDLTVVNSLTSREDSRWYEFGDHRHFKAAGEGNSLTTVVMCFVIHSYCNQQQQCRIQLCPGEQIYRVSMKKGEWVYIIITQDASLMEGLGKNSVTFRKLDVMARYEIKKGWMVMVSEGEEQKLFEVFDSSLTLFATDS